MEKLERLRMLAAYMPCLCMHDGFGPYTLNGLCISNGNGYFSWDDEDGFWEIDETVKPELKPLSKITDEHAIDVAKIILPLPFQKYPSGWKVARNCSVSGWTYISISHNRNRYRLEIDCKLIQFTLYDMQSNETASHNMNTQFVIDELRKLGYDCGFGQIPSLINSGDAVEKDVTSKRND